MTTPTLESVSVQRQDQRAAKRCSDYDEECRDIACHYSCYMGGVSFGVGIFACVSTDQADGYCPYLLGNAEIMREPQ